MVLFLLGATAAAICQKELTTSLGQAITFYASFDAGTNADFGNGEKTIYTATSYTELETSESGNQNESVKLSNKGKYGAALAFAEKAEQVLFYLAENNVAYDSDGFAGTISLWLSLDPENDLEPGFCDPIQITDVGYNDAALWVDFSDKNPRLFRMGVFGDLAIWNPDNINPAENPAFNDRLLVAQDRPFGSGIWTHIVVAYENINKESGRASFYINGKFQGERTISEPFTWNASEAKIFLGLNYIGLMDEVAIFSKMLNAEEIDLIYNAKKKLGDLIDMD